MENAESSSGCGFTYLMRCPGATICSLRLLETEAGTWSENPAQQVRRNSPCWTTRSFRRMPAG